jgi:hypothetical protein
MFAPEWATPAMLDSVLVAARYRSYRVSMVGTSVAAPGALAHIAITLF